jgi:hypothetical protein
MDHYTSLRPPVEVLISNKLKNAPSFESDLDDDISLGSRPNSPVQAQSEDDLEKAATYIPSRIRQIHPELLDTPPKRQGKACLADLPERKVRMPFLNRHKTVEDKDTMTPHPDRKLQVTRTGKMLNLQSPDSYDDDMPPSLSPRPRYIRASDQEEKKSSTPPPCSVQSTGNTSTFWDKCPTNTSSLPFEDEGYSLVHECIAKSSLPVCHNTQTTNLMEMRHQAVNATIDSQGEAETSSLDGLPSIRLASAVGRGISRVGPLSASPHLRSVHHLPTTDINIRDRGELQPVKRGKLSGRSEMMHTLSGATRGSHRDGEMPDDEGTEAFDVAILSSPTDEWSAIESKSRMPVHTTKIRRDTNHKPLLVKSLDLDIGIPKGDILLSLLNEGCPNWGRVKEAIWRLRRMRRSCDSKWAKLADKSVSKTFPWSNRSSSLNDVEKGGLSRRSVEQSQEDAFAYLRCDEFDEALLLYEEILQTYHQYQGHFLKSEDLKLEEGMMECKRYIGIVMHNVGVILFLQGKWQDAFAYFERATWNRSCATLGDSAHVSSLARTAMASYALDDIPGSIAKLEEALQLARGNTSRLSDHHLLAEILNNLGCLSYQTGKADRALELFDESLQIQRIAADHSLYVGSKLSCHQETINMSVTKANIGLLHLAIKDASQCIDLFESAIRDQQLLLRDADATLISTIEHLVTVLLLVGDKAKALQLLKRMMYMQCDAFGPNYQLTRSTANKIAMLQTEESASDG